MSAARGILRIAAVIVGVTAAAVAAWYAWQWYAPPPLPQPDLERAEPAVRAAITAALQPVRDEPRSAAAWGRLGMVLFANGFAADAAGCFASAERFDAGDPRWPYFQGVGLRDRDPRGALPHFRRALARTNRPDQQAAVQFSLALALLETGATDEAAEHLDALQHLDGDSPRVHFGLGALAQARGDPAAARTHYEALVQSPFARRQAHAQLAALCLRAGDAAGASAHQALAARLGPDLAWADPLVAEAMDFAVNRRTRLARAAELEARGDVRQAVAELHGLLEAGPDAQAQIALGKLLTKAEAFGEAEEVLRAAAQAAPELSQPHYYLAVVRLARGTAIAGGVNGPARAAALYRDGLADIDRALALRPGDAMTLVLRGQLLKRLDRPREAVVAYRAALAKRPDSPGIHLDLGETLAELGDGPDALAQLEEAVRLAPDEPRAHEALAKWRAKLGKP